jgi:pimeloyl-ACP methyl ester carboxylesterase
MKTHDLIRRLRTGAARLTILLLPACTPSDTAPDVPRREGFVATEDGSRIRWVMLGEGGQVVMIPMAEYLAEPLAPLADGRRLLFYDPRGRGPSDPAMPGTATEDREIRDMEALRTAFELDSVALLGWSGLGKQVAVYASRHPERVTRVVQVSPVPPSSDSYPQEADAPPREERMDAAAIRALDEAWRDGTLEGDGAAYCRSRRALTQPASFADTSRWQLAPDLCDYENEWPHNLSRYFGELLPSFGTFDWRDSIRAVGRPRLVVHGREDGIPLSGARAWVEGDPTAVLLVLSPAGHFPFLEQPDAFLEAVDAFLRGRTPAGAVSVTEGG